MTTKPDRLLCRLSKLGDTRLIIVGSGDGDPGLYAADTLGARILRRTHSPLLILSRANAGLWAWLDGIRPLRLLIPVGPNWPCRATIAWLGKLRDISPVQMHFSHFVLASKQSASSADLKTAAETRLNRVLGKLTLTNSADSEMHVSVSFSDLATSIASEVAVTRADLIIAETAQRRGLANFFEPSRAQDIHRAIAIPFLCIPSNRDHRGE